MKKELVLLPRPKSLRRLGGHYVAEPGRTIALVGAPAQDLLFAGRSLAGALRRHAKTDWTLSAVAGSTDNGARLEAGVDRIRHAEGYELTIRRDGIQIAARSRRGVLHGVRTLVQVLRQSGARLPCLAISDEPDFPNRGVMLDVSRDKVPTMATLLALVDRLASWKLNQVQLYVEHTFAYRNHRDVWKDASPLTGGDILELDAFCRERSVELVPNQNSFGHMSRWLVLPRYRDLADAPNGCETEWGWFKEPFTLNPGDPRCLELLRELYDELLPHFSSRQFNVGCDETVDLGKVRSKDLVEKLGVGRVYLDFLLKIHREVKARGRTMQFWGDIIMKHPELVPDLPADVVALEWGYEFDHPFAAECAKFAKAGIPFYVCPGTSSWTSIIGRTENMQGNVLSAAVNGARHGAMGFLNTDWGDQGHWQYLPVSYPGFAYGAAVSWAVQANRNLDLPAALDHHAFEDRAGVMGRVACDLGNAGGALGPRYFNATGFARAMLSGLDGIRGFKNQRAAGWRRAIAAIERAATPMRRSRMGIPDAALVTAEFEAGARLAVHGCRRGLLALETAPRRVAAMKRDLSRDLAGITRSHRTLWHARNRPGGFRESVGRMENARKAYR